MKNIIVVGYPKSGNTWLTRLTAELVNCPVVGFWNSDHDEIAREGEDRKSDFRCFKSHHQLHELKIEDNPDEYYIIYIVRDPRDVIVSGAHYFRFERRDQIGKLLMRIPKGLRVCRKIMYKVLNPQTCRIQKMMNAVIHGSAEVHHWCRIPWNSHYKPYLNGGYLFVRYEDLLSSPERECRRILDYLNIARNDSDIKFAIAKQSLARKRGEFLAKGEEKKAGFMRVGKGGQWKKNLSERQEKKLIDYLRGDLERLSYQTTGST